MDFKAKIVELQQKRSQLNKNAEKLILENKIGDANLIIGEMEDIKNQIEAYTALADGSSDNAVPVPEPEKPKNNEKSFLSLGDQLLAIKNAVNGKRDERLDLINAAAGNSEGIGTDGGFTLQSDFVNAIYSDVIDDSGIIKLVDTYTVGNSSKSVTVLMADESTENVYGGVKAYWPGEGGTVDTSIPKLLETKIDLKKMMAICYATDELLEDAPFMTEFFQRSFAKAGRQLLGSAVINGDGVGKPLGFLNSAALVSVAKEKNQANGTILGQNILNMWSRSLFRGRSNLVWILHPDLESQVPNLSIGTDGDKKLIWTPEGGLLANDYQTILGRPVYYDENMASVGEPGDIALVDLKEYMMLVKGAAKFDMSMHVQFLSDQMAFRFTLRCGGAPKINKPIKIKNSTKLRSPFITLEKR